MVLQGACSPFDDLRSQGPFLEALENAVPGELNELLDLSAGSVLGRVWAVLVAHPADHSLLVE